MTVDILCRVVDNLGDIGFVYRLARALSEQPDAPRLRLIVDDLAAFASLCPGVDPDAGFQRVGEWPVARWENPGAGAVSEFTARRPRVVLECYACGRPDWFEEILFDEADTEPRNIVNLEYLTAEPWARDFHRLPSLTRSPLVRKSVFMPGFESGTGGLLIDRGFEA
ncbi:MAG TPA: elongation factor P maturation arginine rhamnosyltransferase EarP, partial [Treponemataceae bacterium]|nr:elongation factor P maturation arginine rhamnosyltransferase EarP [Treponemataceae bacterium]